MAVTNTGLFLNGGTEEAEPSDPTPQDYIAFYPLTGTAEGIGGINNGTEFGGLTYVDDTTKGGVSNYDGVDSYIDLFNYYSSDLSISLWFYVEFDNDWQSILSRRGGNSVAYEGVSIVIETDNQLQLRFDAGVGISVNLDNYTINENSWYHIVLLIDATNTNVKAVLNKVTIVDAFQDGTCNYSTPWRLGRANVDTDRWFSGRISSVRFYTRVLTTAEHEAIYDYELVNHHIIVDDGLIAYYPMKRNSMDNYFNEYDGVDVSVTYDGTKATITTSITVPAATGFVEMYYTFNGTPTYTTTEVTVFGAGTLSEVRKYNRNLSSAEKTLIGY